MENPFVSTLAPVILVFLLSLVVEATIEYLGTPIPSQFKPYLAAGFAMLVCVLYGADILAVMGYRATVPYAGEILTGLIAGRGSNFVNTFWKRLQLVKTPAADVDDISDTSSPRSSLPSAQGRAPMFAVRSTGATQQLSEIVEDGRHNA